MKSKEVQTTLTARDVRHILLLFGLNGLGQYDAKTDSYTYPDTIRKKLSTLERRLEKP